MSYPLPFSETHRDCLQEIANIAMGAAGESLAAYTKRFVELPVPVIRYLKPSELPQSITGLVHAQKVSACAQAFATEQGLAYAMVVVSDDGLAQLAELRALPVVSRAQEEDLLKSLSGVICDTLMASLAELAEREFRREPSFIAAMHAPRDHLQLDDLVAADFLTSVEINYQLEATPFNCELLLLFPESLNQALLNLLDQMLSQ